jgi:hypothetical protein
VKNFHITGIENRIANIRAELLQHPLYNNLQSATALQVFMEYHVFAVWDFMSILKTLQQHLTSTSAAWVPTPYPVARKLINEIVVAEESDVDLHGQPASHYELYIQSMKEAGANIQPVHRLVSKLKSGFQVHEVLRFNSAEINKVALQFLKANQAILKRGKTHEIAAAFTFGREDLIPDLFTQIVQELHAKTGKFTAFVYYLNRHIELDGDEHGPMALQMLIDLCGHDEDKWQEATNAALEALEARLIFWEGIHKAILEQQPHLESATLMA